jgi:Raf kinase inhibitor-like YbhB/YbcL family protein
MRWRSTAFFLSTSLAVAASAQAAGVFTLTSASFKDGDMLAKPAGDIAARGSSCKGGKASPQFSWSNPPEGTKSYAFTVLDPDGGLGAGFVHWVAYGIAPEVTSFADGEIAEQTDKVVAGVSGKKIATYGGPCPPPGAPHHYLFTIVATDLDARELPPGLTFAELQEKLKGHRKAEASLVGRYVNPYPQ